MLEWNIFVEVNQVPSPNYPLDLTKKPAIGMIHLPSFESSLFASPLPKNHATNITIKKPPKGNMTFAEVKFKRSKTVLPNILKSDIELVDNTHIIPKIETDTVASHVAHFRFIFSSSTKKATITSSTEIVEVKAATPSKIKNISEKI